MPPPGSGTEGVFGNDFIPAATELRALLECVVAKLVPFVEKAETEREAFHQPNRSNKSILVEAHTPSELRSLLTSNETLSLPRTGTGKAGLEQSLSSILKYSVNTSAPGFLDKLYAAPLPPGIAAELILAVLNTNVHVYLVSPVLSLVETHVTKALANMFGFKGKRAGGINVQGGSASNMTSIVIARNTLFPETKLLGNHAQGRQLVMFTSEHGHYSIEKAAQQCGFGSENVISVPVDRMTGTMDTEALEDLVQEAKRQGKTPFYVNATAGTTVLGSFDRFTAISNVCQRYSMWMHIDGAWGGSFVFSERLRNKNLQGCERANSIAINPHKMMGVPVTCSFLLLKDLKNAQEANTLRAGYLFHDREDDHGDAQMMNGHGQEEQIGTDWTPPHDLADLTLQCGRRGDSLKLFLSWQYYGTSGYLSKIENAYSIACYLAELVDKHPNLLLVSTKPPPCLQVCFSWAPEKKTIYEIEASDMKHNTEEEYQRKVEKIAKQNSAITSTIARSLIAKGFMIDYAPALSHEKEKGSFFRVVVNISTTRPTVERLVEEIDHTATSMTPICAQ